MNITNLTGLEKPLTKLLEEISKGIGVLYEPTRIRKKALAEADVIKIKTEAIDQATKLNATSCALALSCESDKIEFVDVSNAFERAKAIESFKSVREQANIESILAYSIKCIKDGQNEISDEPLDSDWRSRFFNKSKDVSHEEMQQAWGKILAQEVRKPGTFSLRALEVLSNLTHSEAEIFRKFSLYVQKSNGFAVTFHDKVGQLGFNEEFPFRVIIDLQDCGLVSSQENLGFNHKLAKNQTMLFEFNHGKIFLENINEESDTRFPIIKLTSVGRELLNLLEPVEWDPKYVIELQKFYSKLKIKYVPK